MTLRRAFARGGRLRGLAGIAFPYAVALAVLAMMARGWLEEPDLPCHSAGAGIARGKAHLDPVCRMQVGTSIAFEHGGTAHFFCAEACRDLFAASPKEYLADTCLVCRAEGELVPVATDWRASWQETTYHFCSAGHRDAFREDPAGYFLHTMWGIPSWLYLSSVGLVMLLSFAFVEWRGDRGGEPSRSALAGRRIDLLAWRPLRWLLTRRATRFALQLLTALLFLLIIAAGLFGNQIPSKNIAPILTWTVWWGGLVLVILYLGKAFCYVCPWDALAGWLESLRPWGPRGKGGLGLGLRAPRILRHIWLATFLFVFLTWIELGLGVTLKPRATAYLALLILGLALISALVFERRFFCRYACLVGRISGLYALFSPVEVRSKDLDVCRTCTTHSCYKGNAAGDGCPTWQFPGTMSRNTYCTMCLECLRTCEAANMTLRMRSWGEDLRSLRAPRLDEAVLALLLLALTGFHGLTMTGAWRGLTGAITERTGLAEAASFSLGMLLLMVGPVLLYAMLTWTSWRLSGGGGRGFRDIFLRYSYTILPIAFFYHLAHNAEHLFMEGQKAVALLSDPFGRGWDLFGTARLELPPLVSLSTLWGIQVLLVLIGHVYGVWATSQVSAGFRRTARERLLAHLPLLAAMVLFSVFSLWLLKQPMEMRTSAM